LENGFGLARGTPAVELPKKLPSELPAAELPAELPMVELPVELRTCGAPGADFLAHSQTAFWKERNLKQNMNFRRTVIGKLATGLFPS
jgi:hypothetical protein